MTVHKTRDIYVHHRIPLPEIYFAISGDFPIVYADETKVPEVGVVSALGGEEDWIAVPPDLGDSGSWLGSERINCCAAILDARFGDNTRPPAHRLGS